MEPIDLAVKKTSVKLGISEEVVRRVIMWQWKEVRESLTHPDRNIIYIPKIGSLKFVPHRGAHKYKAYEYKLNKAKEELEEAEDPSRVQALSTTIDNCEDTVRTLTYKAGLVTTPLRTEEELIKATYYRDGKFVEALEELREKRKELIENEEDDYKRRKKNKTPVVRTYKKRKKAPSRKEGSD